MKPNLPSRSALSDYLDLIDESHVYSNYGALSWELRVAYSKYLRVPAERIIPLANATLAIQGCLELSNLENWLVPDYTFAATAHAAVSARKNIFLADVHERDFQITVPKDIDKGSFGILPVMPFGAPIDFKNYKEYGGLVVDAAASLGAPPPDFSEMPESSFVVYSLHATKVLGAGEGALVVCASESQASKLRAWSNFGFSGTRISTSSGTNAKLSEISCAVALASVRNLLVEEKEWLETLSAINALEIPQRFRTAVADYPGFRPYWIVQTRDLSEKLKLEDFLTTNGVESRSWWASRLSDMPAFSQLNVLGENEVSKFLAETHLGLPIWRGIPADSLESIANLLRKFGGS